MPEKIQERKTTNKKGETPMFTSETVVSFTDLRSVEFGFILGIFTIAVLAVVLISLVDNFYNRKKYDR
jgi:hypothetical protein